LIKHLAAGARRGHQKTLLETHVCMPFSAFLVLEVSEEVKAAKLSVPNTKLQ